MMMMMMMMMMIRFRVIYGICAYRVRVIRD